MPKPFARHLYQARKHMKLSQAAVAEALSVNQCTVYHYETGRSLPPNSKLKKLCQLYALDYDATRLWVEKILIERWEHT